MNRRYEAQARFSATGVSTAAILVLMLAMGVSTLVTPDTTRVAAAAQAARFAQAGGHAGRRI
jgi:hypothetical protein